VCQAVRAPGLEGYRAAGGACRRRDVAAAQGDLLAGPSPVAKRKSDTFFDIEDRMNQPVWLATRYGASNRGD
jgi:hypothetical protein